MTGKIKSIVDEVKESWNYCLENSPEVFRYILNISKEKVIDGDLKLLIQQNKDRATKRREADKFLNIVPKFDNDKFNFTKIDQREILFEKVLLNDILVSIVINNSPLTKYHVLIVPQLKSCFPQVITQDCIEVALTIMSSTDDKAVRIGYNSPGALASVNHLHLHLVHVEHDLYIENIELKHIASNLYRAYKIPAFCMILKDIKRDAEKLNAIVKYCCEKVIPHNISLTKSRDLKEIRIFFFPRFLSNFGANKLFSSHLNVAFCELSGYIPVGDDELYDKITESYVLDRFNEEIGAICDEIENDFKYIVEN